MWAHGRTELRNTETRLKGSKIQKREKKTLEISKVLLLLHSYSSDKTFHYKYNLLIMTITDERQGPFRVAQIAAIK